jgi:dTDP-4-amino-4,6-dideoxygalactose transaminase
MPRVIRQLFEDEFCRRLGCPAAVAVNSGTSALVGALSSLDLAGGEVITTLFTFVSTANAIVLAGGRPVFVDIREDNHLLDERLIEAAITDRTRAILPVHLFGRVCAMDVVCDIAQRHGLVVVEDAAQALGAMYDGRYAGTFGDLGCFSFYKTKNLSTFEGGLIAVNRGDATKVRCHVDPICNRLSGFPAVGHNFRMPEPCALIGYEKLKLHWEQALVELGRFTEQNGFYPYVVYQTDAFRRLGITGHCPVAEQIAKEIARCRAS